jgi:O-antigen ligase
MRSRAVLLSGAAIAVAVAIGLAAAVQPLLGLGLAALLVVGLATLVRPDTATLVVVFILYTNAAVVAVRFHGVPSSVGTLFLLPLFIPLARAMLMARPPLVVTPAAPLLGVYLLIQILGILFSPATAGLALPNLITFLTEGVLLYFLVTNVVRTPEMLRRVIWVLLVAGLCMGALSLYQEVTQTLDNNYGGFSQNQEQIETDATLTVADTPPLVRQAGPIGEKNRYAQIMLLLVPLGMFRFWGERRLLLKAAAALCTLFALVGAALTFSRGGAVALGMTLLLMAAVRHIRLRDLLAIGFALAVIALLFPRTIERLTSLQALATALDPGTTAGILQADGAIQGRATEMLAAGLVFLDHPLIGVGPGMFPHYVEEYARGLRLRLLTTNREAHILYLGIAAEHGALGLLCFLGIIVVTLRSLWRGHRRWRHARPELANLNAGFFFVIVVYLTTGLFLHMSYIRYFWLMLALANVAGYLAARATAPARPLVPGELR